MGPKPAKKIRTTTLLERKQRGEKITMLTAYDALWTSLLDEAGVDTILVGDSMGNVILGHADTIPVTLDDMVHHSAAAKRGLTNALLITDMPFVTARLSPDEALRNAARLVQEGGAEAVKIEGGREVVPAIQHIVESGIPVVGHLGLIPQSIHQLGGYRVQGKEEENAERMIEDAKLLVEAGVFMIVLELIPHNLAKRITEAIPVPTIGIGAGPHCDGQVLVSHDMLGLCPDPPAFVKVYDDIRARAQSAVNQWLGDVRRGDFPES